MSNIEIKNLTKLHGKNTGIKDISLFIEKGSFVSIIGPFGSGKTTLLRVLAGLDEAYEGEVLIDGAPPQTIRRERRIGLSFQQPTLLPWRNVIQNIILPLDIVGVSNKKKAEKLLKLAGLEKIKDKKIHELSGGMRQLVAILRSLVLNPDILLLDEPFSSIDEMTKDMMHEKLLDIHRKSKKTTVLVTHSLQEAVYLSDTVIVLSQSPGTVKKVITIDFPRLSIADKYSESALKYIRSLRKELNA